MALVAALVPAVTAGGAAGRAAARAAAAARPRHHRLAGRDAGRDQRLSRTSRTPTAPRPRDGSLISRVVGALWWDRDRDAEQIPELVAKRRGAQRRPAALRLGEVHARRRRGELHRRDDRALPRRPRLRHRRTAACRSSIRSRCATMSPRWTRWTSRRTSTRSATGRSARAWTRSPPPGAANGRRDTRPHLAHLQVVHPDDVPRFRRLGATATIQALWATHEPQMDELTLPFLDPVGPGGSTRSATCTARAPPWPRAATGR